MYCNAFRLAATAPAVFLVSACATGQGIGSGTPGAPTAAPTTIPTAAPSATPALLPADSSLALDRYRMVSLGMLGSAPATLSIEAPSS
jgi:hypothetical protein